MPTPAQFPLAGTLTGTEIVGVMKNGAAGPCAQTTTAAIAALGGGPSGPETLGQQALSFNTTFAQAVANAPLVANYQFGSTAASGPNITTITDLADLQAHFNPFEDFTNLTTINSEFERYQPFNASNHQFLTDRLNLTTLNPNNDWNCTTISQIAGTVNLNNTPTPIANL